MNRFLAAAAAVLLAFAGAAGGQVPIIFGIITAALPPELTSRIQREPGVDLVGNTPEEFAAFLRSEIVRSTRVIREAGIEVE